MPLDGKIMRLIIDRISVNNIRQSPIVRNL